MDSCRAPLEVNRVKEAAIAARMVAASRIKERGKRRVRCRRRG